MSWFSQNLLKSGSKPVWLYRFTRGSMVAHYTSRSGDYETPIGAPLPEAQIWTATTIKSPDLKRSTASSKQQVRIGLPRTNEIAQEFLKPSGMLFTEVSIWHGFEQDPAQEYVRMFLGKVEKVQPSWIYVTLVCADEFASLEDNGLTKVIQRPCDYTVFHGGCRLNITDFQVTGNVTAIGETLRVPEAGSRPSGYFSGGSIEFNGSMQMISVHSGQELKLVGVLPGLQEEFDLNGTAVVRMAPGCNKTMDHCNNKFDNLDNYGGFPWLKASPYDGRRIM